MKNVNIKTVLLITALGLSAAGCSTITDSPDTVRGVSGSGETAPVSRQVGKPYVIKGVRYVPHEDPDYNAVGTASWYGRRFHGSGDCITSQWASERDVLLVQFHEPNECDQSDGDGRLCRLGTSLGAKMTEREEGVPLDRRKQFQKSGVPTWLRT